jgi:hypothetical protein
MSPMFFCNNRRLDPKTKCDSFRWGLRENGRGLLRIGIANGVDTGDIADAVAVAAAANAKARMRSIIVAGI